MNNEQGLIYNVTTMVSHAIHEQWLYWMKETHIPAVLATGCFYKFQLVRLLDTDEAEGLTYAVQYYCLNQTIYEQYLANYAPALRTDVKALFGDRQVSFRTLMGIVK